MSWSTRELAERAGTTVNTIRHYHRIGLLEEPERRFNGYKQYEVRHLVSFCASVASPSSVCPWRRSVT